MKSSPSAFEFRVSVIVYLSLFLSVLFPLSLFSLSDAALYSSPFVIESHIVSLPFFFETANGIRFTMLEKCLCTYFTPSSRKVNWNDISNNTDALTLNIYFSMCVWVAVGLLENQVLLIVFMKRIACSMLWVFCVWLRPMIIRHTILDSQMEHGYIVLVPGASQNETSKNEIFTHFSKLDYPSIYIFYYLYFAIASNGHTHSWMRATTEKRALRAVTNCVLASRKCICVMLNDKNQREINTFICISNKYS